MRNEKFRTKIVGGYNDDKSNIFMCRTAYNYYNRNEMIPGKLSRHSCYVTNNGEEDIFFYFNHRYEVLVLKS